MGSPGPIEVVVGTNGFRQYPLCLGVACRGATTYNTYSRSFWYAAENLLCPRF